MSDPRNTDQPVAAPDLPAPGLTEPTGRSAMELAAGGDPQPWAGLPGAVAGVMQAHLSDVVEDIIGSIQRGVPDYARPLDGEFGVAVRRGVEVALRRLLLELPGRDEPALSATSREVYVALGKGEARTGRPMEALLSAYRIGARVAFRAVARVATQEGMDPEVLILLGESIFVYIDELSAASIEAFTAEQFHQAGERDRRRANLVEELISGRTEETDLRALATRAGWSLPRHVVIFVVPIEHGDGLQFALGDRGIVRSRSDYVVGVSAAPLGPRGRTMLDTALAGRHAWIGPVRPWLRAASSYASVVAALSLPLEQPVSRTASGPWWVDDHLSSLVLFSEPEIVADLAQRRLAPLRQLRQAQRERLAQTLLSWLSHQGERRRVAAELHVHPQTVGYRVGQLREAFGEALEDPLTRFELELVLRAGHH